MSTRVIGAGDHAFASGAPFLKVTSVEEAQAALESQLAVVGDTDARVLVEVWRQFSLLATVGDATRLGLGARVVNRATPDRLTISDHVVVRGCLRVEPEGRLSLAPFVYVGDNVIISAQEAVEIGEATLVAHGVMIFDNNSHPINPYAREIQFRRMLGVKDRYTPIVVESAPIKIGRRCWIGMNSMVLKGVTIGDDTVVASGSVVVSDLPAGVVAGGNPARVLRALTPEELAPPPTNG